MGYIPLNSQILIGETQVESTNIIEDLDTPWEILWGPDNWIWMTERYGRISRVNPETGELQELLDIAEVEEKGEGGLLGMVLHPDFEDSSYVYVVYNYDNNQQEYREKVVRFTYESGNLTDPYILLDDIDATFIHNGSRLLIDEHYKLYMTTGDAAQQSQAQNINSINGKILRMNLDGSVPDDNPIAGSYIWSWGHRNPQGMVQLPDGQIIISEHGPDSDDEINLIQKAGNYGWPEVRGFCEGGETGFCNDSNVVEPLIAWTPTLAVCGLDYYNQDAIPEWNNSLLMTTLKNSSLVTMKLNENGDEIVEENVHFEDDFGRLRDICISPDGRVFLATSNRDGRGDPATVDDRILEISATQTTGISDVPEIHKIKVFPNPAKGHVEVKVNRTHVPIQMTFYNQEGQELWNHLIESTQESINVDFLPAGLYHIQFVNDQLLEHQNLIIQK